LLNIYAKSIDANTLKAKVEMVECENEQEQISGYGFKTILVFYLALFCVLNKGQKCKPYK